MFLDSLTHPVDFGISSYSFMARIDHDYFIVLISWILTNPVWVQNSQRSNPTSNSFFGDRLEVSNRFLLFNCTRGFGFTIRTAFSHRTFAASTTHGNTEDDKTLLVLVSQTTSFVRSSWSRNAMNLGQLTILPASNTKQISHNVTLLLAVQFSHVLVGPHDEFIFCIKFTSSSIFKGNVEKEVKQLTWICYDFLYGIFQDKNHATFHALYCWAGWARGMLWGKIEF